MKFFYKHTLFLSGVILFSCHAQGMQQSSVTSRQDNKVVQDRSKEVQAEQDRREIARRSPRPVVVGCSCFSPCSVWRGCDCYLLSARLSPVREDDASGACP